MYQTAKRGQLKITVFKSPELFHSRLYQTEVPHFLVKIKMVKLVKFEVS